MGALLPIAMLLLLACATLYIYYRRGLDGETAAISHIPPEERLFTAEQVAKHNTVDDLWLIIDGKVYDFTPYFRLHPGGEAILRNAGKDSTEGFKGSQHPARVWDMIHDFYIGNLDNDDNDDTAAELAEYTAEEVAKHGTENDLWLIIDGGVYDVTDFYGSHPGGAAIMRNGGGDSSEGFKGEQHPAQVWDMIKEYHIGKVVPLQKGP